MAGLGYLFERFPSFTQTFCYREVGAMRALVGEVPVFSIRAAESGGGGLDDAWGDVAYLPEDFSGELEDAGFRRAARKWQRELAREWGDETEKRRIYEALWLLPRLRERGVGHVHVHFAGIAARTAFWLKRIGGIGFSFTAHANDIFCDEPTERLRMLVAEAAGVVSVSDFSVAALKAGFPEHAGKVRRVYNGVAMAEFPESDFSEVPPLIVAVGRCIEKKGFADLIDACALMGDREFQCEIVGDGPMAGELLARVNDSGLFAKVKLVGTKSSDEIVKRLQRATVFVLPCVDLPGGGKDNLPTVIMEAMAAGLPVVSTPIAGVPEMVIDGETGWLVPTRNAAALADRLGVMLGELERTREMGSAGRRRCAALFALEQTVGELREALEEWGSFREDRRVSGFFKRKI